MMKRMTYILLFLAVLLQVPVSAGAADLRSLLSDVGARARSGGMTDVDRETLDGMMAYAAENRKTIFELLNESALYLKERDLRVRIPGDELRAVNRRYDLGGDRVNTLLPVDKILSIEIGSGRGGTLPEMEVRLSDEHSDFLELGDFFLSRTFGFRTLEPDWFRGGYGVKVKAFIFSFRMDELHVYEPRHLAIYVDKIGRPKKWRIDPISVR